MVGAICRAGDPSVPPTSTIGSDDPALSLALGWTRALATETGEPGAGATTQQRAYSAAVCEAYPPRSYCEGDLEVGQQPPAHAPSTQTNAGAPSPTKAAAITIRIVRRQY